MELRKYEKGSTLIMDVSEIQKKLKPVLEKEKGLLFGYLFGSAVSGKVGSESDIDLAFYLDEKGVKDLFKERLLLIEKIQSFFQKKVEVIILNEISSIFFKFVIIKEGKVIFERSHAQRVDFELKTMQDYYDFQPFLKEYNKAYLQRSLKKLS
ncbi:nucleotidyltransferase domain-containing protein [bacterium]|nr:nucleotidyltransferase domain-containing protein [bacterium]